ncbi:MAG: class I SAM-dependent methyltransferase [Acidimicrobiales bacterium]
MSSDLHYRTSRFEFQVVLDQLGQKDTVLDIGAGRGDFLAKIAPTVDRAEGVDLNPSAVIEAKKRGLAVHGTTAAELGLSTKFSVVCAFQIMEHLEDVRPLVESALSCLEPDGRLFLSVPNRNRFRAAFASEPLDYPPHHMTHWSPKQMRRLAELFDLELVRIWTEPLPVASLASIVLRRDKAVADLPHRAASPGALVGRARTGHTMLTCFRAR